MTKAELQAENKQLRLELANALGHVQALGEILGVESGENRETAAKRIVAEVEHLQAQLAAVPWDALRFCIDIAGFTYDAQQERALKWFEANCPKDTAE